MKPESSVKPMDNEAVPSENMIRANLVENYGNNFPQIIESSKKPMTEPPVPQSISENSPKAYENFEDHKIDQFILENASFSKYASSKSLSLKSSSIRSENKTPNPESPITNHSRSNSSKSKSSDSNISKSGSSTSSKSSFQSKKSSQVSLPNANTSTSYASKSVVSLSNSLSHQLSSHGSNCSHEYICRKCSRSNQLVTKFKKSSELEQKVKNLTDTVTFLENDKTELASKMCESVHLSTEFGKLYSNLLDHNYLVVLFSENFVFLSSSAPSLKRSDPN